MILHSRPLIESLDIDSVADVLRSGLIGQGDTTVQFERAMADWHGDGNEAFSVGSGGAALVLALRGLDIRPGDEVVLPSYVSYKVYEAVLTVGAIPVLCDISKHWTLEQEQVAVRMTRRTRAVIVPHLYGIFSDVESIKGLGVFVVEDCAQAMARHGERTIVGDVSVHSFHPTKVLTTGEGGMAITSDEDIARRMKAFRDGLPNRSGARLFSPMSNLAAALGIAQLRHMPAALARRLELANAYRKALESLLPTAFGRLPWERSMFYRLPLYLPGGIAKYGDEFARRGVYVRRGVDELIHRHAKQSDRDFKTSVDMYESTLSLPLYPALSGDEHLHCINVAREVLSASPKA